MNESEAQDVPANGDDADTVQANESIPASRSGALSVAPELPCPDDDDERETLPAPRLAANSPSARGSVTPVLETPAEQPSQPAPAVAEAAPAIAESTPLAIGSAPPAAPDSPPITAVASPGPEPSESLSVAVEASAPAVASESLPAAAEQPAAASAESASVDEVSLREGVESLESTESAESAGAAPVAAPAAADVPSQPVVAASVVMLEMAAEQPQSLASPAPASEVTTATHQVAAASAVSMAAEIVASASPSARKRKRKRKRAGTVDAERPRMEPAAQLAEPARRSSGVYWVALVSAAALVALWVWPGAADEGQEPETALQPEVAAIASEASPSMPVTARPRAEAPADVTFAAKTTKARAVGAAELTVPEPSSKAAAVPPAPSAAGETMAEPARVTAYKTVATATQNARNCRHRPDSAGKVSVVVEFGTNGRVQRTDVKQAFVNPMTTQCIAAKFSELTIPATTSVPIIVKVDVALR